MIVSYMDESFDMRRQGVFVVGGFLGRSVPIFELERRWRTLRERPDIDIRYFKASECERGVGQFSRFVSDPANITSLERSRLESINREFLDLIVHPVPFDSQAYLCIQGVGVLQDAFYEIIEDANARAILGASPYRLAYDLAMLQCAWAMKTFEQEIKAHKQGLITNSSSREYVSFICDENEQHSPLADEAYRHLKENNPVAAEYMGAFGMADDQDSEALQAADAVVFEVRRALNLALGQWKGYLRKQFNMLADARVVFLITHTTREQLQYIVDTHKVGGPFKLDALMNLQLDDNIQITL